MPQGAALHLRGMAAAGFHAAGKRTGMIAFHGRNTVEIAVCLGIAGSILHLAAFAIYNRQMIQGTSQPNAATWTLWAFLMILNASSYAVMSGDWVKNILPAAGVFATVSTFFYSLYKGKLSRLDLWDNIALGIGLVSGLAWVYYKSATCANLILQISIVISFVPTYRGVLEDPKKERGLPWYMWSTAYLLNLIVVLLRWQGQYQDLVFPSLCFLLHAPVGLLTRRRRAERLTETALG